MAFSKSKPVAFCLLLYLKVLASQPGPSLPAPTNPVPTRPHPPPTPPTKPSTTPATDSQEFTTIEDEEETTTGEDGEPEECDLDDSCEIPNFCKNQICYFCLTKRTLNPGLTIYIETATCRQLLQMQEGIYEGNTVVQYYNAIDNLEVRIKSFVYANRALSRGIAVIDNKLKFFTIYADQVESLDVFTELLANSNEIVVAGYDAIQDNLFFISDNILLLSEGISQTGHPGPKTIKTFGRLAAENELFICTAAVNFISKFGYLLVRDNDFGLNIVATNVDAGAGPNSTLYSLNLKYNCTFNDGIMKFDKNGNLHVAIADHLIMIQLENNLVQTFKTCNTSDTIFSFDVYDNIYISYFGIRHIDKMTLDNFCVKTKYTESIFLSPPLIVKNSDNPDIPDIPTTTSPPKKPELPFWFPYAVGGGGGLLLLTAIILISCICYKCKKKKVVTPPLPPGFTSLNYNDKLQGENHYTDLEMFTDLENFETTPTATTKKKSSGHPTLPAIRSESIYVDLIPPIADAAPTTTTNNIPATDYENM